MNILIVEDEAPAARRLERLVAAHLGARVDSGPAPGGGWVTVLSWKK